MSNPTLALLTDSRFINPNNPDWYVQNILKDDALVAQALKKHDIDAVRVDWADPTFNWKSVTAAVFRTTWDYFEKIEAFRSWIDKTSKIIPFYNDIETIRWNLDKHYLLDMQERGVNIPHTVVKEINQTVDLLEFLKAAGCEEGIVKPTISGAAWNTFRFSKENLQEVENKTNALLKERAMLIQPFLKSVTSGELSLMLFGGKYSHAVKKVPKTGDFRVQDDHGGKVFHYEPSKEEITFGELAVSRCNPLPVYARVDVVKDNVGNLSLMELELIEPELFFRFNPLASEVFASELAKRITLRA